MSAAGENTVRLHSSGVETFGKDQHVGDRMSALPGSPGEVTGSSMNSAM